MAKNVLSHVAMDWPEYKAFAQRLGITEQRCNNVTIFLEPGEFVRVTQEYVASDHKDSQAGSQG